jgi:hypothetical protein
MEEAGRVVRPYPSTRRGAGDAISRVQVVTWQGFEGLQLEGVEVGGLSSFRGAYLWSRSPAFG